MKVIHPSPLKGGARALGFVGEESDVWTAPRVYPRRTIANKGPLVPRTTARKAAMRKVLDGVALRVDITCYTLSIETQFKGFSEQEKPGFKLKEFLALSDSLSSRANHYSSGKCESGRTGRSRQSNGFVETDFTKPHGSCVGILREISLPKGPYDSEKIVEYFKLVHGPRRRSSNGTLNSADSANALGSARDIIRIAKACLEELKRNVQSDAGRHAGSAERPPTEKHQAAIQLFRAKKYESVRRAAREITPQIAGVGDKRYSEANAEDTVYKWLLADAKAQKLGG